MLKTISGDRSKRKWCISRKLLRIFFNIFFNIEVYSSSKNYIKYFISRKHNCTICNFLSEFSTLCWHYKNFMSKSLLMIIKIFLWYRNLSKNQFFFRFITRNKSAAILRHSFANDLRNMWQFKRNGRRREWEKREMLTKCKRGSVTKIRLTVFAM